MTDNQEFGVLVVEDDPAIRRLVTMVLQRHGYRLEAAADGLEAVLKLGVCDYDVMMPHLDGFTFLQTIAENQPERLRRVIVTSAASPAVIRERMANGPFRMLPKPFDIHELVRAVQSCIAAQTEHQAAS